MYLIIIIDYIHHLHNETKKSNVSYNKDRSPEGALLWS